MRRVSTIIKSLGPGLVLAGTCIGVSHIVQSTRAGALYGFGLLAAVVLANIFKFPFFEFAPRYAAATGENLLQGYRRLGKKFFYLYLILAFCLMFPIQAGVTIITAGLFVNLTGGVLSASVMAAIILLVCVVILVMGKYPVLEGMMKVMIILLGFSTAVAFVMAARHGFVGVPENMKSFVWDKPGVAFLVALMGWMPSSIDISVWHSFWTSEHNKKKDKKHELKEALMDFHIGYWGTMVMAILFLSLGAFVMFGTGEVFSNSAVGFTAQVINLYTQALGAWSYPVIAVAAATTMFSTTLACLDAFPRVAQEAGALIWPKMTELKSKIYVIWIVFVAFGAWIVISNFVNSIKQLIDFATILSFVTGPVFAYLNLRAVTAPHVPDEARPSSRLIIFSWMGIFVLTAFSVLFLIWRFFL